MLSLSAVLIDTQKIPQNFVTLWIFLLFLRTSLIIPAAHSDRVFKNKPKNNNNIMY